MPGVQEVMVKNTAANAVVSREQDNPARQPFQHVITFPTGPGTVTVPNDKCLVIEFVSGYVRMPSGQKIGDLCLSTEVGGGGNGASHWLPATLMFSGASTLSGGTVDQYVICQMVRIYASPGTQVNFGVGGSGTGVQDAMFTISGHLVNVP